MRKTRLFFAIQFMLWGMPLPANSANSELVLNNVWLNGIDRAIETLILEQDNQRYAECEILSQLGIQRNLMKQHPIQPNFCLVSSDPIQSEQDTALQAIKLTVPAKYFKEQYVTTNHLIPSKAELGGFLNYDFYYGKLDNFDEMNGLVELGIFKDYWIFRNGMIYRDQAENEKEKIIRLNTSFEIEFPSKYQRLSLGDDTSVYNPLLDAFRFGGISFGTNFTSYPDFIYWNVPTLKGSAILPSTVDLYINGVNLYQQKVTPGHYALTAGANIQQSGEAQVVVEDVLGNRTVQSFPVYINTSLLKPDLNEYNISMGKLRYNYDYSSDDYREFFTNVYFRRGITQSTTLGTNAAYSEDIQNLGLMWTQAISKYALLDLHVSGSHSDLGEGHMLGASLSRNGDRLALGVSSKYYNPEYRSLGYSDDIQSVEYDNLAYASIFHVPLINNLNINYLERRYYPNSQLNFPDTQLVTVGFSRMLGRQASMSFSYYKDLKDEDNNGAYVTLSYNFDSQRNTYLTHTFDEQTQLRYSKSSLSQNGLDYTVGVTHQQNGGVGFNGYTALKMPVGNLYITHDEGEDFRFTQANYQGALVWLDHKVGLTKYVDNAFALVNVGDIADVDVYRTLTPIGRTNKKGYIFVHDIVPYVNYDLSFNQDQLDINDTISYSNQKVIGMNQRGYKVDFPVERTGVIVLRLLKPNNQTFAQASEVYLNSNSEEFFPVDAEGKVYLYGLKSAQYNISLKTKGGETCKSVLNVPNNKSGSYMAIRHIDLICQ